MGRLPLNVEDEILLRHLERSLGRPERVWQHGPDGIPLPVQIFSFAQRPFSGTISLATFGLSRHSFASPYNGTERVELVVCVEDTFDPKEMASLVLAVAEDAIQRHSFPGVHGVLVGEGAILNNQLFEHLYVTYPGYLPEEFEVCVEVEPPVTFCQLLPLSSNERAFLTEHGWRSLEERFARENIDLLRFDERPEMT